MPLSAGPLPPTPGTVRPFEAAPCGREYGGGTVHGSKPAASVGVSLEDGFGAMVVSEAAPHPTSTRSVL